MRVLDLDTDFPKHDDSKQYKKKYLRGAIKDPEVELRIIPTIADVPFASKFDYVILAQSPSYTPPNADFIIEMFKEYVGEI